MPKPIVWTADPNKSNDAVETRCTKYRILDPLG